jgi:cytochrome c oxidase assembly protein subunit 15
VFLEKHFSKILAFLIFLTFDLMLLGAAVRALDAGLTCPDWPMCFGRAIPEYHLGVYMEFIHRCVAGFVSILFFCCFIYSFINARLRRLRWIFSVSFFLLLAQVVMGGLTVLQLLAPGIVTLHLGLATAFLISLVYAESVLTPPISESVPRTGRFQRYKLLALVGLVLICIQILLGGWVASNYAGSVCVDFPTCNGQWFPAWTGPIGAQIIHRLGAYAVALFYTFFFIHSVRLASRREITHSDKITAGRMFMLVLTQVAVGVFNLKLLVPAWLTVVHLGLAIFLMLTMLKLNLRLQARR